MALVQGHLAKVAHWGLEPRATTSSSKESFSHSVNSLVSVPDGDYLPPSEEASCNQLLLAGKGPARAVLKVQTRLRPPGAVTLQVTSPSQA